MIKNDFKINMLFVLIAFLVTSCGVNNSAVQRKSPGTKNTSHVRKGLERFAKQQVGVKYKYGGTTPKGFDCSGFTSYVFNEFNIDISRSSKQQAKYGKKVNLKWAKKGDLLFFGSGGRISHVGMITNNGRQGVEVIHSTSSRGVIVENVSKSSYWKRRIMFARNVLGN